MTYREALAYLDGLISEPSSTRAYAEVKLERMHRLLAGLGDPHRSMRVVLVGGTKGKGSTCAMLGAILTASGRRVGLYSKPHLEDFRERIRVDHRLITPAAVGRLMAAIRPVVEGMRSTDVGPPTYFEVSVALALLHFLRVGLDVALLEVGIGGRLDATNVTDPLLSVITPISFDHTDVLGVTLSAIAGEKAGIIRPSGMLVMAPQPEEARNVIVARCRELGARLVEVGRDVRWEREAGESLRGQRFRVTGRRGTYEGLRLPLLGVHQLVNAATAVAAAEALGEVGLPVPDGAIARGLAAVRWPGRVEVLRRRPAIVLDVAHNPAAITALRDVLLEYFPGRRLLLLFGMLSTKDYRGAAAILAPVADVVVATTPRHPHALPAAALADAVRSLCERVEVIVDRFAALEYILRLARPEDVVCITGSFYLVGELRTVLRRRRGAGTPIIA